MPDFNDPVMVQTWLDRGYELATGALLAIVIVIVGWMVAKSVKRIVVTASSKLDQAVGRFLGNMARYAVLAATVIAALEAVGVKTTSLVALFGAAGLAIGLALQGSLSNFASGVMILIFRPVELKDVAQVGGSTGEVVDIGLFATTLRTPDNDTIVVPNSSVMGSTIVNHTRLGTRRGSIAYGVAYGTTVEEAIDVGLSVAAQSELVLDEPAPAVAFLEMGASSINFTVRCWAKSEDYVAMTNQVRCGLYTELNRRGVEIPFDQIVVHQAS